MKITGITTRIVNADMRNWVFVKVETSEPGLFGYCGARLSKGTPAPSSFSERRFRRIDLSRSPKASDWS